MMIHNDVGSTDSDGDLLPFEEGLVAEGFGFVEYPTLEELDVNSGGLPGTVFVDKSSSLDLNEDNFASGKRRSLDDSCFVWLMEYQLSKLTQL